MSGTIRKYIHGPTISRFQSDHFLCIQWYKQWLIFIFKALQIDPIVFSWTRFTITQCAHGPILSGSDLVMEENYLICNIGAIQLSKCRSSHIHLVTPEHYQKLASFWSTDLQNRSHHVCDWRSNSTQHWQDWIPTQILWQYTCYFKIKIFFCT